MKQKHDNAGPALLFAFKTKATGLLSYSQTHTVLLKAEVMLHNVPLYQLLKNMLLTSNSISASIFELYIVLK